MPKNTKHAPITVSMAVLLPHVKSLANITGGISKIKARDTGKSIHPFLSELIKSQRPLWPPSSPMKKNIYKVAKNTAPKKIM